MDTKDKEACKRAIYEAMRPARRRFIDRIGYDIWDPFMPPRMPHDLVKDKTGRTAQELMALFCLQNRDADHGPDFLHGCEDMAQGIPDLDERTLGRLAFSLWYGSLLKKHGIDL